MGYFRGVDNGEEIRDLMLERLRVLRSAGLGDLDDAADEAESTEDHGAAEPPGAVLELLKEIRNEAQRFHQAAVSISHS